MCTVLRSKLITVSCKYDVNRIIPAQATDYFLIFSHTFPILTGTLTVLTGFSFIFRSTYHMTYIQNNSAHLVSETHNLLEGSKQLWMLAVMWSDPLIIN